MCVGIFGSRHGSGQLAGRVGLLGFRRCRLQAGCNHELGREAIWASDFAWAADAGCRRGPLQMDWALGSRVAAGVGCSLGFSAAGGSVCAGGSRLQARVVG